MMVARPQGGVLEITLNRPAQRNALSRSLMTDLGALLGQVAEDQTVRVVVLKGAGGHFCSGADLKEMAALPEDQRDSVSRIGQALVRRIATLPQVVVALLEGYVLGGGLEVALAADFRLASEEAQLGAPEVGIGLIPGFGGTVLLPALIGPARARQLVLTGRRVSAQEALEMGLVDQMVAPSKRRGAQERLVASLLTQPARALRAAKEALGTAAAFTRWEGLFEEEARAFTRLLGEEAPPHLARFLTPSP